MVSDVTATSGGIAVQTNAETTTSDYLFASFSSFLGVVYIFFFTVGAVKYEDKEKVLFLLSLEKEGKIIFFPYFLTWLLNTPEKKWFVWDWRIMCNGNKQLSLHIFSSGNLKMRCNKSVSASDKKKAWKKWDPKISATYARHRRVKCSSCLFQLRTIGPPLRVCFHISGFTFHIL